MAGSVRARVGAIASECALRAIRESYARVAGYSGAHSAAVWSSPVVDESLGRTGPGPESDGAALAAWEVPVTMDGKWGREQARASLPPLPGHYAHYYLAVGYATMHSWDFRPQAGPAPGLTSTFPFPFATVGGHPDGRRGGGEDRGGRPASGIDREWPGGARSPPYPHLFWSPLSWFLNA